MSKRDVDAFERHYIDAFARWEHTPKWRLLARWYRKREYGVWLDAMVAQIKREQTRSPTLRGTETWHLT